MSNEITQENFLEEVKNHELIVIKDEGLYRHIRFKSPETLNYYFDILTWKGYLCITGDIGTYVFSRVDDMFYFFVDENDVDLTNLKINTGYWAEKCVSESVFGNGIRQFSIDNFKESIKQAFESETYEWDEKIKKEAWEEVDNYFSWCDDEYSCVEYLRHFKPIEIDSEHKICFNDWWEWNFEEKTHNYILCLYAIVWSIKKYFTYKKNQLK